MDNRTVAVVFIICIGAVAAVAVGLFARHAIRKSSVGQKTVSVVINGVSIQSAVSDTDELRAQGLSGRQALADGSGMLFLFPTSGQHGFWMQGMNFPLDFIWIAGGRVTEIFANVPLSGDPLPVYRPQNPVTAMLEVPAGFSQRSGIQVGDSVRW